MLSEQQINIYSFIKENFEVNGMPPRLSHLSSRFGITNNAILTHLKKLEREGLITMPEGVLSIQLTHSFINDIFLSYSSKDKTIAKRMYDLFTIEGFRVWKDNMKLSPGDKFTDEILKNIKTSKIFIVLISNEALISPFVKEEVSKAYLWNIQNQFPKILPVIIKKNVDMKLIFNEIQDLQRINLFDYGYENVSDLKNLFPKLADTLQSLIYPPVTKEEERISFVESARLIKTIEEELKIKLTKEKPPEEKYPYFQVIISPEEHDKEYNITELRSLISNNYVRINGWGGDRFPPYYGDYGDGPNNSPDGIEFFSTEKWMDRTWALAYFKLYKNLFFFMRNTLKEAFRADDKLKNIFAYEWAILDISRIFMYIRNISEFLKKYKWKVTIRYRGLQGKQLAILSFNRGGFFTIYEYKSGADFVKDIYINQATNYQNEAVKVLEELMYMFQWNNPNVEQINKDVARIFEGRFLN